MSRQFLRSCTLSLSGSSSATINGGGEKDLRIEFLIGVSTLQQPHPARFRVYNPDPQTITQFQQAAKSGGSVEFFAGYIDSVGSVYRGDVKQTLYAHETPVDSYIDIFCATLQNGYQAARVTKTLAKGWTPQDKAQVALDALKPFGITGFGLVNVDLSTPAYPRGRPFVGMARDLLRQVALAAGATWSVQGDKIDMLDHSKPVQTSGPIVLNSQTGLVSFPQQTEDGIIARCLINPAIKVHGQVKIDESSIVGAERDNNPITGEGGQKNTTLDTTGQIAADGIYRVVFQEISGDTRGQDWYMTLTCVAISASPNQAQIEAGGGDSSDAAVLGPL